MRKIIFQKLSFGILLASLGYAGVTILGRNASSWSDPFRMLFVLLAVYLTIFVVWVVEFESFRLSRHKRAELFWQSKQRQAFNYLNWSAAIVGLSIAVAVGLGHIRLHGADIPVFIIANAFLLILLPLYAFGRLYSARPA